MLDAFQPPVQEEPDEGDPSPCPEDVEFFVRPDAAGIEEAIGKFLDGLEGQECRGCQEMHRFLATLPVPTPKKSTEMTHAEALEGQLLPNLDDFRLQYFSEYEYIL
jgi:hypothetical protein